MQRYKLSLLLNALPSVQHTLLKTNELLALHSQTAIFVYAN